MVSYLHKHGDEENYIIEMFGSELSKDQMIELKSDSISESEYRGCKFFVYASEEIALQKIKKLGFHLIEGDWEFRRLLDKYRRKFNWV